MRTRIRVTLGLLGVVLALFVVAAPAFAADEGGISFADNTAQECYNKLAEGKTVDDCQKAPNPLLPAANEMIWGSLAFAVLFVAMLKFGVPAVRNMEKAREDKIRSDLESAERGSRRGGVGEDGVRASDRRRTQRSRPHRRRSTAVCRGCAS